MTFQLSKNSPGEILLEDIGDKVQIIAEGHQVIRSEMKQMEQRLSERIDENKWAIQWVAKELGRKIEDNRKAIEGNRKAIEDNRGEIKALRQELKSDIKRIEEKLSADIGRVERKVDKIDQKLEEHIKLPAHV